MGSVYWVAAAFNPQCVVTVLWQLSTWLEENEGKQDQDVEDLISSPNALTAQ